MGVGKTPPILINTLQPQFEVLGRLQVQRVLHAGGALGLSQLEANGHPVLASETLHPDPSHEVETDSTIAAQRVLKTDGIAHIDEGAVSAS